jgi:6-O-methylguanine DNA methyltransferase-like protein
VAWRAADIASGRESQRSTLQRLIEAADQILGRLEADRQADHIVARAGRNAPGRLGRTTTYGALAKEVGAGRERARDVGEAMAKNPAPLIIVTLTMLPETKGKSLEELNPETERTAAASA